MIVVDASAMVEALVGRDPQPALLDSLAGELFAPHLIDVEVLSVLRGLTLAGKLDALAAEDALRDHFDFTITRYAAEPLADRVWELRHQFGAYDACYLALAEALGAPLHTCDRKLDTRGHHAEVRIFARSDPRTDR